MQPTPLPQRCRLTSIGTHRVKIRRFHDRLIFNMAIPVPGKTVFILRWGPSGCRTVIWVWGVRPQYTLWHVTGASIFTSQALYWRHNERDGVSNHQPHGCYPTVYSDADKRKHRSSALQAFVWGIHRGRWIPRTKGHLRGKCFHLMTSSWLFQALDYLCEDLEGYFAVQWDWWSLQGSIISKMIRDLHHQWLG